MKSLLSIKEWNETGMLRIRFFALFSKIWKIDKIQRADKIEERVDSCSVPILALKKEKTILLHIYCVFLSIK